MQTNAPTEFQVATSGTQPQLTWTDDDDAAFFSTLGGATPQRFEWRRDEHVESINVPLSLAPSGIAANCFNRQVTSAGQPLGDADPAPSTLVPRPCNFSRVAPAIFEDTGFLAALNTTGCAEGQLRVGHTSPGSATDVLQLGPYGRSNTFAGLALSGDGRCSATDPSACDAAREARDAVVALICAGGCDAGERCLAGTCQPIACASDGDCGDGNQCLCGRCEHPAEVAGHHRLRLSGHQHGRDRARDRRRHREPGPHQHGERLLRFRRLHRARPATVAVTGVQFRRRNEIESLLATDEGRLQVIGETRGTGRSRGGWPCGAISSSASSSPSAMPRAGRSSTWSTTYRPSGTSRS